MDNEDLVIERKNKKCPVCAWEGETSLLLCARHKEHHHVYPRLIAVEKQLK